MPNNVVIRLARSDEQAVLESLQRKASLSNPGDRDAILANLDAISLPIEPLWRHGIGRRLVDRIAEVARLRAASFLHVIGNPHPEGFYVSCGFRVTGTVDTRFGVGLSMRRAL